MVCEWYNIPVKHKQRIYYEKADTLISIPSSHKIIIGLKSRPAPLNKLLYMTFCTL